MKTDAAKARRGFFTTADLLDRYGISDTTLRIWRKERGFPAPIAINSRVLRWEEEPVFAWERRLAPTSETEAA